MRRVQRTCSSKFVSRFVDGPDRALDWSSETGLAANADETASDKL